MTSTGSRAKASTLCRSSLTRTVCSGSCMSRASSVAPPPAGESRIVVSPSTLPPADGTKLGRPATMGPRRALVGAVGLKGVVPRPPAGVPAREERAELATVPARRGVKPRLGCGVENMVCVGGVRGLEDKKEVGASTRSSERRGRNARRAKLHLLEPSLTRHSMEPTTQAQADAQARPYAHLTARSFTSLIRNLDDVSRAAPARKVRRVADVDSPSSASAAGGSSLSVAAFQALTGSKLAHLHRERRRSVKAALTGDAAAQAGSSYAPFSQAQLLGRIRELAVAPTTAWVAHAAKQAAPLELALRGWGRKEGNVRCVTCDAEWSTHDVNDHKDWCPWRCRGCNSECTCGECVDW